MKFEEPLQWNPQIPRTIRPDRSRFRNRSAYRTGEVLSEELSRLGASDIIISSNLRLKTNGGFYASQHRVEDVGVCIYFKLNNIDKCFACDKWDKAEDNLWALKLNVEAMRGMERWGGSNFMDGLFTGFKALPSPDDVIHQTVQYFSGIQSKISAKWKYLNLAKELHPDMGGDPLEFAEMKRQYEQLRE